MCDFIEYSIFRPQKASRTRGSDGLPPSIVQILRSLMHFFSQVVSRECVPDILSTVDRLQVIQIQSWCWEAEIYQSNRRPVLDTLFEHQQLHLNWGPHHSCTAELQSSATVSVIHTHSADAHVDMLLLKPIYCN